jgi:hypothetical protein
MNKQILALGMVTLLVCIGLSGCNSLSPEEKRFVGVWSSKEKMLSSNEMNIRTEFRSNKRYSSYDITGSWEVKNGKLFLYMFDNKTATIYDYSFSNNDSSLILISETYPLAVNYTRQ